MTVGFTSYVNTHTIMKFEMVIFGISLYVSYFVKSRDVYLGFSKVHCDGPNSLLLNGLVFSVEDNLKNSIVYLFF